MVVPPVVSKPDGFLVPRSVVWGVLVLLPSMLISGTTFVVFQTVSLAAVDVRQARLEARIEATAGADRVNKLEAKLEATNASRETNRAALLQAMAETSIKLTRVEAQLGFLVASYAPAAATVAERPERRPR